MLLVANGPGSGTRVGFTVSRKVGNAVVRNRVRRRLREIVRQHQDLLCNGLDYVIVAFPPARSVDFAVLQCEMTRLLQRAHQWGSRLGSSSD